jgi:hypothetical protein
MTKVAQWKTEDGDTVTVYRSGDRQWSESENAVPPRVKKKRVRHRDRTDGPKLMIHTA